jgi:hypothetical protein
MSTQLRRQVFGASRLPEHTLQRDPDITALNSDWNGITRLRTSIAPLTCDICGAAPCIQTSFCRLCRQLDAKAARMRPAAKAEWLRGLSDDGVSLERVYAELNQRDQAAASTVEALMYLLRRGVDELAKPETQRRLYELSEDQLRAVCERLQNFNPKIAAAWTPEEIEALMNIWSTVHGH